MIESRRSFLQKLFAASVAVGLDPLRSVTTDDDVYTNTRLGLIARRPSGWDFSSIADFASLRNHQVVMDAVDGEIHPLKDPDNLPVFIFENGTSRKLSIRSLLVFREPRVHTFHFVESPASPRAPEAAWAKFIESVSYAT